MKALFLILLIGLYFFLGNYFFPDIIIIFHNSDKDLILKCISLGLIYTVISMPVIIVLIPFYILTLFIGLFFTPFIILFGMDYFINFLIIKGYLNLFLFSLVVLFTPLSSTKKNEVQVKGK